jgi:hypothetical protein
VNKETLSKHKYIYTIDSGAKSIQRFPVIYVNKHYVYYKVPANQGLSCIRTEIVRDSLSEARLLEGRFQYVWGIDDDARQLLSRLKTKIRLAELESAISSSKARCTTLSTQLEKEKQRCADLELAMKMEFHET